jgi:hypothetical protein
MLFAPGGRDLPWSGNTAPGLIRAISPVTTVRRQTSDPVTVHVPTAGRANGQRWRSRRSTLQGTRTDDLVGALGDRRDRASHHHAREHLRAREYLRAAVTSSL